MKKTHIPGLLKHINNNKKEEKMLPQSPYLICDPGSPSHDHFKVNRGYVCGCE